MTRTDLSLAAPLLLSILVLPACIPPASDPGGEGATDAVGPTDESTSGASAITTGADDDAEPDADEGGADETAGDPPADGDGEDDGGPADDDGLACDPSTHACLSAMPDGWAGPTTLTTTGVDAPLPACEGAWSETFHQDLFAGFDDGGDATCTCGCWPEDLSCEVEASLSYWDPPFGVQASSACQGAALGSVVVTDGVTLANQPWVGNLSAAWRLNWSEQTLVGDCAPASSESIPEATFSVRVTACGLPHAPEDTCGFGDVCTPRPSASSSAEVCIYNEGEHECPAGDYTERKVYYRDIEDTRDCPYCECGEVSGSCTNETFTPGWYDGEPTDIAWDEESVPLDGSCNLILLGQGTHNAMAVEPGQPVGGGLFAQCGEVAGSEVPFGQATPSSAVTFCCTEL